MLDAVQTHTQTFVNVSGLSEKATARVFLVNRIEKSFAEVWRAQSDQERDDVVDETMRSRYKSVMLEDHRHSTRRFS